MEKTLTVVVLLLALTVSLPSGARVLLQPVPMQGSNLLKSPGFESAGGWVSYEDGFERDQTVHRTGASSARCESTGNSLRLGVYQTIVLNQKTPRAIRAAGYSRALDVAPGELANYSIYLDIQYDDGSWVWGQLAPFHIGTHDWESAEVLFTPARPIHQVLFYVLFRNRTGKVWFDDLSLVELTAPAGTLLFDGTAVRQFPYYQQPVNVSAFKTNNKLSISLSGDGSVAGGSAGALVFNNGGGFYLRDAAANSAFYGVEKAKWIPERKPELPALKAETLTGEVADLGLQLMAQISALPDRITVHGTVRDLRKKDRAVTVGFAIPIKSNGCRWGRDIYRNELIQPGTEYTDVTSIRAGAVGAMSLYPWGCLQRGNDFLALAIPMDQPRVYRIGYHAGAQWYTIAFDLGLAPDGPKNSEADFHFVIYHAEGESGFRAVTKRYYDLFPGFFVKRVAREGLWMPFTDISTIRQPEDFGFAYHEGDNNIAWDNAHGVYAFRYSEPMSYWLPLDKDVPRTPEAAFSVIDKHLVSGDANQKNWAMATKLCAIEQSDGTPYIYLVNAPWCDGGSIILNCNPAIPENARYKTNRAHLSWNPDILEKLYGKSERKNGGEVDKKKGNSVFIPKSSSPSPRLDGEYIDSLEMGSDLLNFRREHFQYSGTPLTYETASKRVAIMQLFSTYDFMRPMASDLHSRGKLLMANAVLWRYSFPAHLLDVLGTEADWNPGGRFTPLSDSAMGYRRAVCYKKPYCFLQNTDFKQFGKDKVEKYMQHCLFFGMFPGFFSHNAATDLYFATPDLYERDRPLFRKYIPVIKKISAAGWEPVTMAKVSNPAVMIERFGPGADRKLYFTMRNNTSKTIDSTLTLDPGLNFKPRSARKLPSGGELGITRGARIEFALSPDEVAVIEIQKD